MKRVRRFSAAIVMAGMIAAGMAMSTARLEAKKPGGGDPQAAICAYLLNVIKYPYVNYYIKTLATSLYLQYGCDPALLPPS